MNEIERDDAKERQNIYTHPRKRTFYNYPSDDEYSLEDDDEEEEPGKRKEGEEEEEDGEDNVIDDTEDEMEDVDGDEEEDEEGKEDEERDSADDSKQKRTTNPLILLLEMMMNPVSGWKKIRRARLTPEKVASGCFYPLIGIAAASCFMECVYESAVTLSMGMVNAVKVFISLFFGNFVVLMAMRIFLRGEYKSVPDTTFGKEYVMMLLSTLALFLTLYECLPMIGPILVFLPLWTIYLAIRGIRFFRFPEEKQSLWTTLICLSLLGAPIGVYYIFDILL